MRSVVPVLAVVLAAGVAGAATASNSMPASIASYQSVQVTGATMSSIDYTVAANQVTAFTAKLRGVLTVTTAQAAFNGVTSGACTIGVYDALSNTTPITCTGFQQPANASWRLVITVS